MSAQEAESEGAKFGLGLAAGEESRDLRAEEKGKGKSLGNDADIEEHPKAYWLSISCRRP